MKFYEAPDFTKVEFFAEDVLADSVIDPGDLKDETPVVIGPIDVFKK